MKILIGCFSSFLLFSFWALTVSALASDPVAAPGAGSTAVGRAVQVVSLPPPERIPLIDPITLYGGDMLFDVYRKGTKVGEHTMSFSRDAIGDITVKAQFSLAIDILFIRAYTFNYGATEIWRDNQMVALGARSDDDGKITETRALFDGGVFKIDGTRGPALASSWVFPTNHWHRGQVESSVILNTLTGRLGMVSVENMGVEKVEAAGATVDAERFAYSGDLHDTDVWYDNAGRWVKMRFKANDGSTIEYKCRACGVGTGG